MRPKRSLRPIAGLTTFAALIAGLPLMEAREAAAGDRCRYGSVCVRPARPWDAWRAYYEAQAAISYARRAARANYYVRNGRALPSRFFGPPTNTYAESYAQNPYSYFNCPLARRGEGVCSEPDFFAE